MIITLVIFTFAYCLFILKVTSVWKSLQTITKPKNDILKHYFSILIPIRNEEVNIPSTLESILANNYEKENYEIIVINDHSTDKSVEIIEQYCKQYPNVKLLELEPKKTGKKQAITCAIGQATGDIILCTDGDCMVKQSWIERYNLIYQSNKNLQLVFGGVQFHANNQFEKLLQIELMGLIGIGAASAAMGHPSMINGANFSYKKEAFLKVNGYDGNEQIPSGDDEFLLRKIFKYYPNGVKFLKHVNAIVKTDPPKDFNTLFNQRKRWASKWKLHEDWFSRVVPMAIFLFNLMIIYGFCLSLLKFDYLILLVLFKPITDFIFMHNISRFFSLHLNFFTFFLLQIIYPFYVVFFGIASNFGAFTWKERKY